MDLVTSSKVTKVILSSREFRRQQSTGKYSPPSAYRYYKHQKELETLVKDACGSEKDSLQELLGRFYQQSAFIAQHHKQDEQALSYMNEAVDIAFPLKDVDSIGAALYKRSRINLTPGTVYTLLHGNTGGSREW